MSYTDVQTYCCTVAVGGLEPVGLFSFEQVGNLLRCECYRLLGTLLVRLLAVHRSCNAPRTSHSARISSRIFIPRLTFCLIKYDYKRFTLLSVRKNLTCFDCRELEYVVAGFLRCDRTCPFSLFSGLSLYIISIFWFHVHSSTYVTLLSDSLLPYKAVEIPM